MPAPEYGRTLRGLGINLVVREIERALPFQREVLGATVVYADPDIAVLRLDAAEWMLHAAHTYDAHPLHPDLVAPGPRGLGVELRMHGRDPDAAAAAARRLGYEVVQAPADKPHGLREAFIRDRDGFLWVTDVPLPG
ncbi:MAG: VOC family protein [Ectothiorhodospiraceae bacterium]|nr:VOC family protein [Chromatiales bacterium]MCP5157110.1 VOC family protein [Ectothiorhodospiraceae bacterium]